MFIVKPSNDLKIRKHSTGMTMKDGKKGAREEVEYRDTSNYYLISVIIRFLDFCVDQQKVPVHTLRIVIFLNMCHKFLQWKINEHFCVGKVIDFTSTLF